MKGSMFWRGSMKRTPTGGTTLFTRAAVAGAAMSLGTLLTLSGPIYTAFAEQPPAPCHPNPQADLDEATVRTRGDVVNLPGPLKDALARLANRPHTQLPQQIYGEAPNPSQLFQYYLLYTNGFEPNVF